MTTSSSTHTNDRFPVVTKRPRTYHRHRSATSQPILCFFFILAAFLLGSASAVVIMLYRMSQDAEGSRPSIPNINQQRFNVDLSIQTKLSESLTTSDFVNVSSVDNEDNAANKLFDIWRSLSPSLDRVNKFSYDVMLSKYVESSQWNGIQLLDGRNDTELLKIDRLPTNELISFSSLLKSGTIDGKFVYYVNYGRQEDFAHLFSSGIWATKRAESIIFMRRRSSIISQTEQIHQAIYYGFGGLVLFDDHVNQQIATNNRHTFFEEWRRYLAMQDRDDYLNGRMKNTGHSICVLTLSYDDVQRIFGSLQPDSNQWPTSPLEWHNQSTPMKIGGPLTTIKLRLVVNMQQVKVELPIVMSSIRGSIDAEHFVMIGHQLNSAQQNHIVNQIVQTYVNQMKNGWKPKRSILFCGWSGLSYDRYAVRRWISENSLLIDRHMIAYLDLGNDISGNSILNLHGSPLLEQIAFRAANYVISPLEHNRTCHHREMTTTMTNEENHHHDHNRRRRQDGDSHGHEHEMKTKQVEEEKCEQHKLLDEWIKANRNRSLGIVQSIDVESSASIFLLEYGIPSIVIEMTNEKGLSKDTFYVDHERLTFSYENIQPEVFVAYTQFIIEFIRQLIDEPMISFNLTNYADQLDKLVPDFVEHHKSGYESVAYHIGESKVFMKILNELIKSIRQVQLHIDETSKTDYFLLQLVNEQLIEFERLFISKNQLYGMNSENKIFKHILFGPVIGLTNTIVPFPLLSNIIYGLPGDPPTELCDASRFYWLKLKDHILLVNRTINGFDGLLTKHN
ncbi:unnamed protein product [Adineta ricciae]|nr:unnamed protein product [Adineta ricciae]